MDIDVIPSYNRNIYVDLIQTIYTDPLRRHPHLLSLSFSLVHHSSQQVRLHSSHQQLISDLPKPSTSSITTALTMNHRLTSWLYRSTLNPSARSPFVSLQHPIRSLSTTCARAAPPRPPAHKMSPPAKKMTHLQAINALPSQYPDFRTVLWTGESSQIVVMTVPVDGEIGEEVSTA